MDALRLIEGLQVRHPTNPLFHQIEAEIHAVYRHDPQASYVSSARLLELAEARQIHEPALASANARLNMAIQLDRRGDRSAALELLQSLLAERPARPHGATARAEALLHSIKRRTLQ